MPRKSKRPRIEPLEPPYDEAQAEALGRLGPPIALFRVLAGRPDLARGVSGWGRYYLSRQSALTLRQRELVIDRVVARCGADYEWGVHILVFAGKAGLTAEQVRSLASGNDGDPCWTDRGDRAVLRAVDRLHDTHDLDDASWTALVDAVGEDGALDVLLLAGWYHAISYAVRALRLPMEPGTPMLSAQPGRP
ncbi:carboxymuconolactone decarboxylase family protein [Nocardioides dilutus]